MRSGPIIEEDLHIVLPNGDVIDYVEMQGKILKGLIEDFGRGFGTNGFFNGEFLQVC